ncbi:MAG TPA: glycosyltransferase family A protein [Terracidiphilus sp.]
MSDFESYVIVTPARNEARFIELTLSSVVAQNRAPLKWVIVSDGSTDGTDAIVQRYASQYPWIELLALPDRQKRDFAGKAHAFNQGYARVKHLNFDVIASLDADVSFDSDYFAFLLGKLAAEPLLGLAGTPFRETCGESYDFRFASTDHVSGACQVFRRACFESIGGYLALQGGGVDLVAVVTARMKGWQTRTYPEKVCLHHRAMNSAMNRGLKLKFKWGQSDYRLGGHPVWQVFRCCYQMSRRPYVVGGIATLAGYYFALLARRKRSVSAEFIRFRGEEQLRRLKRFFTAHLSTPRTSSLS